MKTYIAISILSLLLTSNFAYAWERRGHEQYERYERRGYRPIEIERPRFYRGSHNLFWPELFSVVLRDRNCPYRR